MNSEKPSDSQHSKSDAPTESNKQSDKSAPEVSSTTAQPQSKPSPHCYKITCDKKRDWIDKATLGLEGFGLFVLIVYTIATIVYACITYRMWGQMQEQTKISQRQLEALDRPWLKVTFSVEPITFQQGGMQIGLRPSITNIGHSVATGGGIQLQGFLAHDANTIFNEPLKRQKELCGKLAEEPPNKHLDETQITIFPGDTDNSRQTGISFSKSEIDATPSANPNYPEKRLLPIMVGCVDYQYGTSTHHHQTGFIYEIQRLDPVTPPHIFAIQLGREVPASNITLIPYAFGGFAAN